MTPEEIKAKLKEKKIRQSDLCRRWGEKPNTVHYLIKGTLKSARLERLLARAIGVKVSAIRERKAA